MVGLYIRVSTDKQAQKGDSLDAQQDALIKYCRENNYTIYDTYIDGGESGQKISRTNLTRMLEDVKNKKIDMILMTKLDRWFRNVKDFYKVIDILEKNNCKWKTIWESYDTTTPTGQFMLTTFLAIGQLEAQNTGERIRATMKYKREVKKEICTGKVKLGYKKENKHFVIDEEKKDLIINLYNKYLETGNLYQTHKWFNSLHSISIRNMKRILTDPAYNGRYVYKKTNTTILDYYPKIINDDLFNKVNNLLNKGIRNNSKRDYIFTGLLFCGECNTRLAGSYAHIHKYYRCKKHLEFNCSSISHVREDILEEYLVDNIENIIKNYNIKYKVKKDKIKKVEDKTKKINEKKNKLLDLYLNNMVDKSTYEKQFNELNIELEKNMLELKKYNSTKKNVDKYISTDILSLYKSLTDLEKRYFWREIIEKITINGSDYNIELKVD